MFVIGKAKKQGVLKTLRNSPVHIHHKERAEWIVFYLKNKNIQLLRICNVKLIFLPLNTTSVSQLMDQGIIRCLKTH